MPTPLAADAAFEAGRTLGSAVWALVFVALFVRKLGRLDAPGVNRKGVWASLLAYGGIVSIQVTYLLMGGLPGPAKVVLPAAVFVVLLVAVTLGIQALLEVRAARRAGGMPESGGAGWAVGLSIFTLVLMSGGFVAAVLRGPGVPGELRAAAPAAPVRNEALNFGFEPPAGFVALDPKKLNPVAAVAYARASPQVFFMIIAESGIELSSEEMANLAQTNLETSTPGAVVEERGPHTVNGLAGFRLRSLAKRGQTEFTFVHWTFGGRGFVYQLVTWGASSEAEAVARNAEILARGFRLLDPDRRPSLPAPSPERRWSFRSPAWRYRVELDRGSFSDWTSLRKDYPKADFGARCGDGCGVAVFPLRLPSPQPSLDAVARALIDMLGLRYPGDGFTDKRSVSSPPAEGFELGFRETQEKTSWDWRLRTVTAGSRAWLVAGYSKTGDAAAAARRDAGVEAVKFELPVAGEAPPAPVARKDQLRQARALNEMGLHEYDLEQYARAAPLFAEAFGLSPGDRVLLHNAADAHAKAGLFAEGLALVDGARARFPGDAPIDAFRALLASRAGREREALRDYARLFARGFAGEEHLHRYVELLEAAGRRDEALRVVVRHRRRHDGRGPALLEAALECRAKRPRAEIATLRKALARKDDARIAHALVEALLEHGPKGEALREAEAAVRRFPGTGSLLVLRGRGELALRRYAEAKVSFEKALEHDPASQVAKDYLEHVSGTLGEGQNSSLKEPIAEVAVPDGLLGPPPQTAPEGYGAWFADRVAAISFVKGKELRRTDLLRGKATDAAGVERLATFDFSFDPLAEQIFVNRVLVRDAAGRIVARGKPGDWYLSDQATGALGTHRRNLHLQVPGLRPGLEVEVAVTRRDLRPPDRMDFVEHSLASSLPRLRSALVVTGDVDAVASGASEGVATRRAQGALAFVAEQTAVFRAEPLREDHQEWLPTVWLGPSGASWTAEARAYEEQIAGVDRPDPEVEALAAKETKGLATPEAKLFALARWVQRGITYRAIEFGRRARVPHPLPEILKSRFGDCKDHALALKRLLEAAGVPARLALVRADGPIRPALPSLDQFDHMIVWVPGIGAGTFVDVTDKGAPPGAPPPGLGGKQALVLEGDRSRLVDVPPETNGRIASERTVTLGEGELEVHEKVRFEGPPAAAMRSFLAGMDPVDRAERLQGFLSPDGAGLRVTSVRLDALEEVEKPLALELRYLVRGARRKGGGELSLPLPAVWERRYLGAEPVARRESPFRLTALEVRSVVELAPPEGHLVEPPPASPAGKGVFSRWERVARANGPRVRIESTLARPAGRYPAPRWAEYRDEMERALSTVEPTLSLRPAPAGAGREAH